MKGNALTLGCFLLGIAVGLSGLSPEWLLDAALPSLLLSLLILQVGVGLGANDDLRGIVRSLRLRMLLLPLFTIAGSLLFSAAAALLPGNRPLAECLAVADTVCHVFAVIAVYQLGAPAVYQNAENDENRRDNKHQNRIGQQDFYLLDDAMCR